MANLVALSPCEGLLPKTIGAVTLAEVDPGQVTSVLPFKGQEAQVGAALKDALGVGFPSPNRLVSKAGIRALWVGKGQALLMGGACPELGGAACVDQSDAWCVVEIAGEGAESVLARLVPLDLRASVFKRGHTARSLIGHMTGSITRTGENAFEIMVFRSMAETLVEELTRAAEGVAARG